MLAGRLGSGSIAGTIRWPTITESTPAAIALRNGTNSTVFSRSMLAGTRARVRCESVSVSPWPGKCLAVVSKPSLMRALDVGRNHFAHLFGIFAEGARINNGIGRIGIDIRNRKPVPLDANGARLLSTDAAEFARQVFVARRAKGHGRRKRRRALKTHRKAALKVGCENQRVLRILLQPVGKRRGLQRLALESVASPSVGVRNAEAADVVLGHLVAQFEDIPGSPTFMN